MPDYPASSPEVNTAVLPLWWLMPKILFFEAFAKLIFLFHCHYERGEKSNAPDKLRSFLQDVVKSLFCQRLL
jgi:hypothetical protein